MFVLINEFNQSWFVLFLHNLKYLGFTYPVIFVCGAIELSLCHSLFVARVVLTKLLVILLTFLGLFDAVVHLLLFISCRFGLLIKVIRRVAVGTEDFNNCELKVFTLTFFELDQMRVTVCLNERDNLVLSDVEAGIVVVSELELVFAEDLKGLVASAEDENVARHISIVEAAKNEDLSFVEWGTEQRLSSIKSIICRD